MSPTGALKQTFASARANRNFRLFLMGQFVSAIGTWMTFTATGWLVWQLTRSGSALGVNAALQFGPMLVIGAFGASTVIGSFIFGWPSIIAVIINYVKRSDAKGTWLESHFQWQIRTFWYAMLASLVIGASGALLAIVLVGFAIWAIGFFLLGIWAIYRIAAGWMRLNDRRAIA